jgi:nucleoside-diphosphate kinase
MMSGPSNPSRVSFSITIIQGWLVPLWIWNPTKGILPPSIKKLIMLASELIVLMTEQDHHLVGHVATAAKPTKKLAPMTKVRESTIVAPFPLLTCGEHLQQAMPKNLIDNQVTFAILKPDLVERGLADKVITEITQKVKLKIILRNVFTFSRKETEEFYKEHRGKPFFGELVEYMTAGPSIGLVLYGPDAVMGWRELMGPTNPVMAKKSAQSSLRAVYGRDLTRNSFHGSDSLGSASREIQFLCRQIMQQQ